MKLVTVVGARPQFVKAFVVSRALAAAGAAGASEVLLHTGQHYDRAMSDAFFDELELAPPRYNLGVGSASHGAQTAAMLAGIEEVLLTERPDLVLVYGDTNSTLAGGLAAAKLRIPVGHVEAGLRSFRRDMPEEVNRVVADHLADLLFAPTATAVANLAAEGRQRGVWQVGDVMLDAVRLMLGVAERRSDALGRLGLTPGTYGLATIHRAANTEGTATLATLLEAFARLDRPVVFPVHPRTRVLLQSLAIPPNVRLLEPVGYLDMLVLERHAHRILTDSGGVQKEAYFLEVPCVTLREETEWPETLVGGWNVLAGADPDAIAAAWRRPRPGTAPPPVFGAGDAGERIAQILLEGAAAERHLAAASRS